MSNVANRAMAEPAVAVIMSVYKKDKPIDVYFSMQSILAQSYNNFQVFIRVDGSISQKLTDLMKFYAQTCTNVRVFWGGDNIGLARSMNFLIDYIISNNIKADYYARMDADDICAIERLHIQVNCMLNHPETEVLGSWCAEFGLYNKIIKKDISDLEIKRNIIKTTPFIHPTVLFSNRVFIRGFRYPVETHLSEDLSFWLLLASHNFKFYNIDHVLLYYRITENTLNRRTGLRKALSELKERFYYIGSENYFGSKNRDYLYMLAHFILRISPLPIVRCVYKVLR